ncbi:fimbrial protein [Serratia ureilytica]|uniref:fimbrial protein n=1 Tax=Serratia ureilytica TaxID=300181 RepID=UPI00209EC2A5|nr:fimbrial protein [Serratia ureilytica]
MKIMLGFVGICICSNVFAGNHRPAVIDGGIMHMRGAITAPACIASTRSNAQIIDLGEFRSNQFNGVGTFASPVPFYIHLARCNAAVRERVAITFLGVSDSKDPLILRTGQGNNVATGIGLAIFNNAGDIVQPNMKPDSGVYLNSSEMALRFVARYRATSLQVTGGNADAWTWFSLSYQ